MVTNSIMYGEHGISKDQAVTELQKRGYDAYYDKGVVKIPVTPENSNQIIKEVKTIFEEIDYRMSYGFSPVAAIPIHSNVTDVD